MHELKINPISSTNRGPGLIPVSSYSPLVTTAFPLFVSGSGSFLPVLSNHHPITIHSPSIASRQGDRGDRNRSYWRSDNDNDSVSKWLTYVLRHGASEVRHWEDPLETVGSVGYRQGYAMSLIFYGITGGYWG